MSGIASAVDFDEKMVDAIFADLDQCHLPGVTVGIAIDGSPVYRKGFGIANIELPIILSPTIRMRLGSTSKHFASLAYLLLCEEGRADVDDSVGDHLTELHPITRSATLRQLMGHTSGLRDAHDIVWQFSGPGRSASSSDLLALYRGIDDVNAPPGVVWSYNYGGYLILTAVIERITGQSLEQVLRERIFEPVGMYNSSLRRSDADFVANSATLHMTNAAGGFEKSSIGILAGEGGIVSTVDDMLRWLAHMESPDVGTATTWEIMKAPQRLANGTSTGYGLGLMTDRYRGIGTISHSGGLMGGSSQMIKAPEVGLDIVTMANRHDVLSWLLANKIMDACLTHLDPHIEASALPFVTGTFRSLNTHRVIQLLPHEEQQVVSVDGCDWPFVRQNDAVLRPVPLWGVVERELELIGKAESPDSIQFNDYGNVDVLVRQKSVAGIEVNAIVGRYRSSPTHTVANISETDEGAQMVTLGRFGSMVYLLKCLAEGIWRAQSAAYSFLGGVLVFEDDYGTFYFSSHRTWALSFRRDS